MSDNPMEFVGEYMQESKALLRIMKPETDYVFVLRPYKKAKIELQAPTILKGFERLRKAILITEVTEPTHD